MDMLEILKKAVEKKASDIHFVVGRPPMVRIAGEIVPLVPTPNLMPSDTQRLIYSVLNDQQRTRFEQTMELDCSIGIQGLSRFRVNVLRQKNGVEAALRVISAQIPTAAELRLPPTLLQLTKLPRGMVLVTGQTGTGKSTTLACLLNIINSERRGHILTIEDPIEYVFDSKNCIVRQREVESHTHSFANALKHALRQDPDVILVGEMRDLETIALGITAAETGHLVFASLHTQDAPQTVDRMIDVFPPSQQQQVRIQLSNTLQAVVCQQLLPRADGQGRVAAQEVMIVTPAIANLIRESKTHQIYSAMETGGKFGMVTTDTALAEMVKLRLVSLEVALTKAHNPETVKMKVQGLGAASLPPGAPPPLRRP